MSAFSSGVSGLTLTQCHFRADADFFIAMSRASTRVPVFHAAGVRQVERGPEASESAFIQRCARGGRQQVRARLAIRKRPGERKGPAARHFTLWSVFRTDVELA